MSVQIPSEQDVLTQTLNYFRLQFPSEDLSDRSFLGLLARIFASESIALSESILAASYESPPSQQTSSVGLDNWAYIFGLPNGGGSYGRRGSIPATGGIATISGLANTTFPSGLTAVDSTSQIIIALSTNTKIPASTPLTASATFTALVSGAASNLPVGSVLTWQSPPVGATPTFTLTTALIGGEDVETDSELLARILFRLQNPPKGGTAADYREWAEESVNSLGISNSILRAYIYPLKSGTGSVDIIVTQAGTGPGRIPSDAQVRAVQSYVDTKRPVTAKAYVRANINIQMNSSTALTIYIRGIPNLPKYAFDWDDLTNGPVPANPTYLSISNYDIANQKITVFQSPASTNLYNAVQAASVSQIFPRISYYSTAPGSPVLPYILTVDSVTVNTIPSPTYDFHVVANPVGITPAIGTDVINAASTMTIPVLTAVSKYIDSLGPSRASGYADPYDNWFSNVSVAEIGRASLDVVDTDGINFLSDVPNIGQIPDDNKAGIGVIISVAGSPSAKDYIPKDRLGIPEIAYCAPSGLRLGRA